MPLKPVVLCILDGWGNRADREGNAPLLAHTPTFDRLMAECPSAQLSASGEDVGLPPGQIGNSEVGHTNIGAGRVVWMDLPRINRAIEDGSFFSNAELVAFMTRMRDSGGAVHLMGLISAGGVHSHQRHVSALALALSEVGIPVNIHAFMDGRDVAPTSGRDAMLQLLNDISSMRGVRVATVSGRFYAMDRDKRWDRVRRAWAVIADGTGHHENGAIAAIDAAYARGETDEFIEPTRIGDYTGVASSADGLLCANFRADRARELLSAFLIEEFDAADAVRDRFCTFAATLGMVSYSDVLDPLIPAMFAPQEIVNTLGEWVASHGLRQFRLAETEKYPHVTFFLNGGIETPDPGEERCMAPSPKVRTYDLQPEMSAGEVTEHLVEAVKAKHDLIVVNFANPDMVGHTGSLEAAIAACEAVDTGLSKALEALEATGGAMLVTADHGNCEMMIDPSTGGPHTAHTTNLVPVILVEHGSEATNARLRDGRLADLAPTLLSLMGLQVPPEMTGKSLLVAAEAGDAQ